MVCMASSWVSKRENCCARQVGGRLGLEPGGTPEKWAAGRASEAPATSIARCAYRDRPIDHLSLQKFHTLLVKMFRLFRSITPQLYGG